LEYSFGRMAWNIGVFGRNASLRDLGNVFIPMVINIKDFMQMIKGMVREKRFIQTALSLRVFKRIIREREKGGLLTQRELLTMRFGKTAIRSDLLKPLLTLRPFSCIQSKKMIMKFQRGKV